jgi:ubiquinone/menaquinone biosynthesis C-methylase UbiE
MDFPINNLEYFVEWGGKSWEHFTRYALTHFIGQINGKEVLEIGFRKGKMSVLFALLGATVTGVDIKERYVAQAQAEAKKFGVSNRARFFSYDGALSIFPDCSFDLIFTKSVLIDVPELEMFLWEIRQKLRDGGKVVFIENAKGSFLLHTIRKVHHSWSQRRRKTKWNYRKTRYFTKSELSFVESVFTVKEIKKSLLPPVYLILGEKD